MHLEVHSAGVDLALEHAARCQGRASGLDLLRVPPGEWFGGFSCVRDGQPRIDA